MRWTVEIDAPLSPEGVRIGRFLFLGPSGSGKTYIAGHFVRELRWPPELIRSVAPPTKPTLSRLIGAQHIAVDTEDRETQERVFDRIFTEVTTPYTEGGHDIGLALDDSDFYFSQSGRSYGSPPLARLVKLGREAGLSQVFVAQGSSAISKDLISNSSIVFMARTTEPNLLDYARRYMRDIPDAERIISNLPTHVFLVYAPNGTPKLLGFAKVVNGVIVCKEPENEEEPQEQEDPEESTPSTDDTEASKPEPTAASPAAERPSPTGSSVPGPVTTTEPPSPPRKSGSGKPSTG